MLTIKVEKISAAMYGTIDELKKSSEAEVCLGLGDKDIVVSKDTAIVILQKPCAYSTGIIRHRIQWR